MTNTPYNWATGEQLFQWGFIRGYSLMIFLGVIMATLSVVYFWRRYKYSWEVLQMLVIIVIPLAFIGAKFYTLVVDGGWDRWYYPSGLSIYGALLFSISSGMIYLWFVRHVVDFRTVISIVLPSILLGQAIGRWGNFMNHELYGKVVSGDSLNWLTFLKDQMFINGEYRAPIFLYESLLSLLGYFIIVWVLNRKSIFRPGTTAGLYFIWYGIERLILQLQRDGSPTNTSYIGNTDIPLNLVVSALVIALGLALVVWYELLTKPLAKWVAKILPPTWAKKITKQYKIIRPIKPRRIGFFGEKVEYKRQYLLYWGKEVPNVVKLYIPVTTDRKYSKREINRALNEKT